MTLFIVVEGQKDEQLIGAVMTAMAAPGSYEIVVAEGKSHAVSVAGTMLTLGEGPVVLVIDADTTSEHLLAEQRSDLRALLNRAATPDQWRLAFLVPELEIALVYDEALVQRLFGRSLDEIELALREVAPKKAFDRLLSSSKRDWMEIVEQVRIDPEVAAMVAKAPGMREIVEFAQKVIPNAA
jgi:hypothetical protein